MSWLYWAGVVYGLAGIGILVAARENLLWPRTDAVVVPSASEGARATERSGISGEPYLTRRRLWLLTGWSSLLTGVLLLLIFLGPVGQRAPQPLLPDEAVKSRPSPEYGKCTPSGTACLPISPDSFHPRPRSFLEPVVGLVAMLLASGVLLLLVGDSVWTKFAGAAVTLTGIATGSFGLIHEMKIDNLVKFEITNKLDELKVLIGGRSGTERLALFDGFASGESQLEPGMTASVGAVCDRWERASADGRTALLLVVGATDRAPLSGRAKVRFESNFGLARARSEAVRKHLVDRCAIPPASVLSLVSGPRNTEKSAMPPGGFPQDRSVEVWAFWTPSPGLKVSAKPMP